MPIPKFIFNKIMQSVRVSAKKKMDTRLSSTIRKSLKKKLTYNRLVDHLENSDHFFIFIVALVVLAQLLTF